MNPAKKQLGYGFFALD